MNKSTLVLLIMVCEVGGSSTASHAQFLSDEGIHGTGEIVLERKPELMHLQISLLAKGKDLPEAIANLKTRRAKAEKQLESLGAAKDSVKFGDLLLDQTQNDQQRQLERMLRQRMSQRRGGKRASDKDVAVMPVSLSIELTADWPLKTSDTAELLTMSKKLQDAIKAADLAGAKEAAEPTPEEAELAEEMEETMSNYGGREGPKPGEPVFLFVATIPEADREKALAEAFRAARSEASRLAKAADIELGALRSLQSTSGPDTDDSDDYRTMYNRSFAASLRQQMSGRDHSDKAIGQRPGKIKYKVTVNASFAAK